MPLPSPSSRCLSTQITELRQKLADLQKQVSELEAEREQKQRDFDRKLLLAKSKIEIEEARHSALPLPPQSPTPPAVLAPLPVGWGPGARAGAQGQSMPFLMPQCPLSRLKREGQLTPLAVTANSCVRLVEAGFSPRQLHTDKRLCSDLGLMAL